MEDVNLLLNSGEVSVLFDKQETDKIIGQVQLYLSQSGANNAPAGGKDYIWSYFLERMRANLHVVICMSPAGDTFRNFLRTFPSLVSSTTIDCFFNWTSEALLSVATRMIDKTLDEDADGEELGALIGG